MSNERRSKCSINNEMSKEIQCEVYIEVCICSSSNFYYFISHLFYSIRVETKWNWCSPRIFSHFFVNSMFTMPMRWYKQQVTKTKMKMTWCMRIMERKWMYLYLCVSYQENIDTHVCGSIQWFCFKVKGMSRSVIFMTHDTQTIIIPHFLL